MILNCEQDKIDVVVTVGERDVDRLFRLSLVACFKNADFINDIFVVTDSKTKVSECLKHIDSLGKNITTLDDREVLSPEFHSLPGWYRQQLIKLNADQIAKTRLVACLGADTIILRRIQIQDIVEGGRPILYYNRDPKWPGFARYEGGRVINVAKILGVKPIRSLRLADFIMDFNVLNSEWLVRLREFLGTIYGSNPFAKIIPPGNSITPSMRKSFGEWSLYAVFILDVLNLDVPVRNSNSRFLAQVQNEQGLRKYEFDSQVVHFVQKNFDLDYIKSRLKDFNLY